MDFLESMPVTFKEIIPNYNIPEKWKEVTLNTGLCSFVNISYKLIQIIISLYIFRWHPQYFTGHKITAKGWRILVQRFNESIHPKPLHLLVRSTNDLIS